MAYVRKTDSIYHSVRRKIDDMFRQRLDHAHDWYTSLGKPAFDYKAFNSLISEEEQKQIQALGERHFERVKSMRAYFKINVDGDKHVKQEYTIDFPNGALVGSPFLVYRALEGPHLEIKDEDLCRMAAERHERVQKVREAKEAFFDQVKEVWDKSPSVNRFVKLWPAGRDLLEPSICDQIDQKAEKQQKIELSDEAKSALNASLLGAKVAQ